jgi:hypothetical protein
MKTARHLDGLEELFWFYEQSSSFAPVFCIELQGTIPNPDWRDHLLTLQALYPLLRCRIRKTPGERARFQEVGALEIPLASKVLDTSIELEMQRELDRGFHLTHHALARLTVCRDGDRTLILITAHHAAFDGRSIIMMIHDLLALAAGEEVDAGPRASASIGELLSMGAVEGYSETLSENWISPTRNASKPSSVVRKVLSEKDTAAVLAKCKSYGVSVSAGLAAAMAEAGRGIETSWRKRNLNCLVPIDLRPFFDAEQTSGVLINVLSRAIPVLSGGNVWDLAIAVYSRLTSATSTDAFVRQAEQMRAAFVREQQPADIIKQLKASAAATDISVNNYGRDPFRTGYGAFRLVNASSGNLTSHAGGQKVSIINLDGRMTLTGTSVEPIPNLLNEAVRIMLEQ